MNFPGFPDVGSVLLKKRSSVIRQFVATTTPQKLSGEDNSRQMVLIQNKDAVNTLNVSFQQTTDQNQCFFIGPSSSLAIDTGFGNELWCFSTAGTVNVIISEITGFDDYQLTTLALLAKIAGVA